MNIELFDLIPKNKYDLTAAEAAVSAGYPTVKPILPELLEWLQDGNWPVYFILQPLMVSIGADLAPYIRNILKTDDHEWKYFVIQGVVGNSPALCEALRPELERLSNMPSEQERSAGVHWVVQEVLKQLV